MPNESTPRSFTLVNLAIHPFVRATVLVIHGLFLATLIVTSYDGRAREGESMAPGVAHLVAFTPGGHMKVRVLEQEFTGTWRNVTAVNEVALLAAHWRGSRESLSDHRIARAQLHDLADQTLVCEFVVVRDLPSGVCEQPLRRLYYLQSGS